MKRQKIKVDGESHYVMRLSIHPEGAEFALSLKERISQNPFWQRHSTKELLPLFEAFATGKDIVGTETWSMEDRDHFQTLLQQWSAETYLTCHVKLETFEIHVRWQYKTLPLSLFDFKNGTNPGLKGESIECIECARGVRLKTGEWLVGTVKRNYLDPDEIVMNQVSLDEEFKTTREPTAESVFRRDGDFWRIVFEGRELKPLRHLAGMTYLHALLARPGHEFTALDLYEIENPPPPEAVARPSDNHLEPEERMQYGTGGTPQKHLEGETPDNLMRAKTALEMRIEDADLSDKQREHIQDQIEAIDKALTGCRVAKATGGATFEAKASKGARQTVAASIERALDAIADQQDGEHAAKHLRSAIHKGNKPCYAGTLHWET